MTNLDFLRRNKAPQPEPAPIEDDAEVRDWLTRARSDRRRINEMESQIRDHHTEIDVLHGRVNLLNQELNETRRARDEYQKGFAELRAQLGIVITQAESAFVNFKAVADSAIRAVNESMVAAGVDTMEAKKPAPQAEPLPQLPGITEQELATIREFGVKKSKLAKAKE
jgi:TolA-binding protein